MMKYREKHLRFFLLFIHLFLTVISITLIVISVKALQECKPLSILVSSSSTIVDLIITCLAISCLSSLCSFFFIALIFRPKLKWASVTHVILSLVSFIAHLTIGIFLLYRSNWLPCQVTVDLERSFIHYGLAAEVTNAWDSTHSSFSCCGIKNFTDFETEESLNLIKKRVPQSCCQATNDKQDDLPVVSRDNCGLGKKLFMKGCQPMVKSLLLTSSSQIGSFMSFVSIIWLLSCLISSGLTYSLFTTDKSSLSPPPQRSFPFHRDS